MISSTDFGNASCKQETLDKIRDLMKAAGVDKLVVTAEPKKRGRKPIQRTPEELVEMDKARQKRYQEKYMEQRKKILEEREAHGEEVKPGRPPIYKTEEERKAARREASKKYRQRVKEASN